MLTLNRLKKNSLKVQLHVLEALLQRHVAWVKDSNQATAVQIHREIVDLLTQVRDAYRRLLDLSNHDIE